MDPKRSTTNRKRNPNERGQPAFYALRLRPSRIQLDVDLPVRALPPPHEEVQAVLQDLRDVDVLALSQDRGADGAGEARLHQRDVPDRRLLEEVLGHPRLRVKEPDTLRLPRVLKGGKNLRRTETVE